MWTFFFPLKLQLFFLLPFLFGFRVGGEHQSKELHTDWLVSFLCMMVMTTTYSPIFTLLQHATVAKYSKNTHPVIK
jgi:hypothetical protein